VRPNDGAHFKLAQFYLLIRFWFCTVGSCSNYVSLQFCEGLGRAGIICLKTGLYAFHRQQPATQRPGGDLILTRRARRAGTTCPADNHAPGGVVAFVTKRQTDKK
jgi:hypothetical protein